MLPATDHPTQPAEFYKFYAVAIRDVLRRRRWYNWPSADQIHCQAAEVALRDIGYAAIGGSVNSLWVFRQNGFDGRLADGLLRLPVETIAERVAEAGVNMLNEACRRPDVPRMD